MINPSSYVRATKGALKAIRWDGTAEQAAKIVEWLGIHNAVFHDENSKVYESGPLIDLINGPLIYKDEWIMKYTNGKVWGMTDEAFNSRFVPGVALDMSDEHHVRRALRDARAILRQLKVGIRGDGQCGSVNPEIVQIDEALKILGETP